MSKILRRPMFRGGRVDSRGTGITSGLMDDTGYADGGRVGFFRGGYSTIPGIDDLSQVGYNPFSFQNITPLQRRQQDIATTNRRNIFSPTIEQIQRNEMRDILGRITPEQKREMDIRTQAQAEQEDVSTSKFALANPPIPKNTGTGAGTGAGKGNIDLLSDEEDITRQAKLYQKLLGGDEARTQAGYDALLAAAPAFFKGRNLREAIPQVFESVNKSGAFDKPRDIKQAAAQLAIQRRMLIDKAGAEEKTRLAILSAKNQRTITEQISDMAKDLQQPYSAAANIKGPEFFGDKYVGIAPINNKTKAPDLNQMVEDKVYFFNNRYISIKNGQLVSINP